MQTSKRQNFWKSIQLQFLNKILILFTNSARRDSNIQLSLKGLKDNHNNQRLKSHIIRVLLKSLGKLHVQMSLHHQLENHLQWGQIHQVILQAIQIYLFNKIQNTKLEIQMQIFLYQNQ